LQYITRYNPIGGTIFASLVTMQRFLAAPGGTSHYVIIERDLDREDFGFYSNRGRTALFLFSVEISQSAS
jgi:hypothetical protein